MLAELDRTGESQISLTDPDSRAMAAHTHVAVGYNVQIAVDVKHKMIVEQQVSNQIVDMGLLAQTAEPAVNVHAGGGVLGGSAVQAAVELRWSSGQAAKVELQRLQPETREDR